MHNMEILRGSSPPFKKFQGNVPKIQLKKLTDVPANYIYINIYADHSYNCSLNCYLKSSSEKYAILCRITLDAIVEGHDALVSQTGSSCECREPGI